MEFRAFFIHDSLASDNAPCVHLRDAFNLIEVQFKVILNILLSMIRLDVLYALIHIARGVFNPSIIHLPNILLTLVHDRK